MHELNIVKYVIEQVEDIMQKNELTQLASVTLQFGEVSGIVPDYLTDCWKWYGTKKEFMKDAELKCETIPAFTWCNGCRTTYPTVAHGKICPNCGSEDTWLSQGNEMNIKEIEAC